MLKKSKQNPKNPKKIQKVHLKNPKIVKNGQKIRKFR